MARIGIFGWGVVAPRSPDVGAFKRNLETGESWLSPFNGFGPDNFLVGRPDFDLSRYRDWIDSRFPANRYHQIEDRMDPTTQFAVGAFIQALEQNPGLEKELARLGTAAHVYVGTGLGALPTIQRVSLELDQAQREWDAFWEGRGEELGRFLNELAEIEALGVSGEVEEGKMRVMREKQRRRARLVEEWGAPPPPWEQVSPNLIWNIHNTPASQISMLGRITGLAFAPVAACSTFGVCLKLAVDAIRRGEARAVVVGGTDPPPHPLTVGAFYRARVLAAHAGVSKPLGEMRGTHVSGGSVIWIVGDYDHMLERGFEPVGMEPLAVGVSSDADHIITPSREGPLAAIRQALGHAGVEPADVGSWDLHATGTPGDALELDTFREDFPKQVLVTARKGTFGHGMSAGGGWELTAQYLGYGEGRLFPTPLADRELNPSVRELHDAFVLDEALACPPGVAGKLSMGVGGVNACVISRPWG